MKRLLIVLTLISSGLLVAAILTSRTGTTQPAVAAQRDEAAGPSPAVEEALRVALEHTPPGEQPNMMELPSDLTRDQQAQFQQMLFEELDLRKQAARRGLNRDEMQEWLVLKRDYSNGIALEEDDWQRMRRLGKQTTPEQDYQGAAQWLGVQVHLTEKHAENKVLANIAAAFMINEPCPQERVDFFEIPENRPGMLITGWGGMFEELYKQRDGTYNVVMLWGCRFYDPGGLKYWHSKCYELWHWDGNQLTFLKTTKAEPGLMSSG